ncbi:hypothetical protein ACPA9J_15195 [Pseudomonas aeruginosa]
MSQDGGAVRADLVSRLCRRATNGAPARRARGLGSGHLFKLSGYPARGPEPRVPAVGAEYLGGPGTLRDRGGGVGAQFESELDCI